MKRLFAFFIATLLLVSSAYAEIGATAYTPDALWGEHAVYIYAYNDTTTDITSNAAVILDTTNINATSGTTLGIRVTTTTTAGDNRFLGITDEIIESETVGRVCVRGPHLAQLTTTSTDAGGANYLPAGASLITSGTAGRLKLIAPGDVTLSGGATPEIVAIGITQGQHRDNSISGRTAVGGTPPDLFWVWIK